MTYRKQLGYMSVSLKMCLVRFSGEGSFIMLFLPSHWQISGTWSWEIVGVKLPAMEMCTEYSLLFFFNISILELGPY